jgi:CheY-like chemotaxis protein
MPLSHKRLIVEDDPDTRYGLKLLLAGAGYEADAVPNGQEALDYLHAARELPCLILLDLKMPVMDGWQFLRGAVRAEARAAHGADLPFEGEAPAPAHRAQVAVLPGDSEWLGHLVQNSHRPLDVVVLPGTEGQVDLDRVPRVPRPQRLKLSCALALLRPLLIRPGLGLGRHGTVALPLHGRPLPCFLVPRVNSRALRHNGLHQSDRCPDHSSHQCEEYCRRHQHRAPVPLDKLPQPVTRARWSGLHRLVVKVPLDHPAIVHDAAVGVNGCLRATWRRSSIAP